MWFVFVLCFGLCCGLVANSVVYLLGILDDFAWVSV